MQLPGISRGDPGSAPDESSQSPRVAGDQVQTRGGRV